MRTTQQMSITLPNEMARLIRQKVAAGEYASESEVIRDGLRTLMARDRAVETWLQQEVAPALDRLRTDPGRGISGAQVRAALASEHATAKARMSRCHLQERLCEDCQAL
jgi:antitoxin ParD1/3/4